MLAVREIRLDGPTGTAELADGLRAALFDGGPAVLPLSAADPGPVRGAPPPPGIAVVVATSGSTGEPKGVLLAGRALESSAIATHARLGGPGRWLLALPAHRIAGLQVLVRSLLAGHEPVVLPGGGFRPERFADAAAPVLTADGPRYVSLVPTQLARLLAGDAPASALAALRAFDTVLVGGAATSGPLLARARDAGVAAVTTYGMTETAGGCVYDGVPLDGVEVATGSTGLISLRGPMLASGYWNDPEATAAAFASGWFHTSDLGELRPDGSLAVLGRADHLINTGGVKVVPSAVEDALLAVPGVSAACVVDLPDAEWGQLVAAAVVPADPVRPPAADQLRAVVHDRLGGPATPKVLRVVSTLPERVPGKVDRDGVRAMLTRP